jgi:hypothetical protein
MTTKITDANIDSDKQDNNAFNISLLGFKMAVNEGLTVFNLVDGVVDEFNDESGTDEAEGSNDLYCGTSDYYINSNTPDGGSLTLSAGFTTSSVTEPDTSTAGTNPTFKSGTYGSYTVPSGISSINIFAWGAAGGQGNRPCASQNMGGGGGGFGKGTLATTGCTSYTVVVGEGGLGGCVAGPSPTKGLGGAGGIPSPCNPATGAAFGGGMAGVFTCAVASTPIVLTGYTAPTAIVIAGGGGGGGYTERTGPYASPTCFGNAGAGGGLIGDAGDTQTEQTSNYGSNAGGGDQEQGGQGGSGASGTGGTGQLFAGGNAATDSNIGSGGGGYYGGGGAGIGGAPFCGSYDARGGGGGSSYYNHPQITCGSTEEGVQNEGGGVTQPNYVAGTNEGFANPGNGQDGEDGYVLITACQPAVATSTTIVSEPFTSTSVATSSRIVVFEENVDTPTLNTDIIASISRDGGTTFTNATLSDSGYVTGSSGQRILTGQADISGQPSGQSMRWKLALANNTVKIHGVSLQWS